MTNVQNYDIIIICSPNKFLFTFLKSPHIDGSVLILDALCTIKIMNIGRKHFFDFWLFSIFKMKAAIVFQLKLSFSFH